MSSPKYQKSKITAGSFSTFPNDRRSIPLLPNDRVECSLNHTSGMKELPILLMLDVSPSMQDHNRMTQQNTAVRSFLTALCQNSKVRNAARVAFYLFTSDIEYKTRFMQLDELTFHPGEYLERTISDKVKYSEDGVHKEFPINFPVFKAAEKGGTNIPLAVTSAVHNMQEYTRSLAAKNVQKYVPFLVFTSDGNPDLTQNAEYTSDFRSYYMSETRKAADSINNVCNLEQSINDLIIPFFIGIGDAEGEYLRNYCTKFSRGVIMVDGRDDNLTFTNIFKHIAKAIAQSIVMQNTSKALINTLTETIKNIYDA